MDKHERAMKELLPQEIMLVWEKITEALDTLYDVERLWNKGFGD